MSGRNRQMHEHRNFRDLPPAALPRGQARLPPPHLIEEELVLRRNEMHRIHTDNRMLMEEIVGLRREMPAIKDEIHVLSQAIPRLRAEKELQSRELIQRGLKLEADLRTVEPLKAEVQQLRSEIQKVELLREELSTKAQGLSKDLQQLQSENVQIPTMRAEIDSLHQELSRARAAYDFEKKASTELIDQVQAMEKRLVSMARETEKLRAEVENRRVGPGNVPGIYGFPTAGPESFSGMFDMGPYGSSQWPAPYDPRSYPRR